MTALNLTPLLDSLAGAGTASAASFRAVAMRAGRGAVRVTGGTVTFPTEVTATWGVDGWDVQPALYTLPTGCYWAIRVSAAGSRLEGAYILPHDSDSIDFGDLIAVSPATGVGDTSTLAQWLAVQQYIANQTARIDGVAATIFSTVGTVQAQIDTAATATAQATAAAADAAAEQATLAAALADVTTNTQAATAAALQAALDRVAADADAAATAADRAAITGVLGTGTVQDQITAAVTALVGGAPGALDTLKELADAIGDDANFAATVTNALATKANLSALAAVALSGAYSDLTGRPVLGTAAVANATEFDPIGSAASAQSIAIQRVNHTGTQPASTITGLATVATSGAYPDLTGKPTLGTAATAATTDFDAAGAAATAQAYAIQRSHHTGTQPASTITGLAAVATSGAYTDLTGIPTVIDGNA